MSTSTTFDRPSQPEASTTDAGLMSPQDKSKLDNLNGVPAVTSSDNGKVLKVENGIWAAGDINNKADKVSGATNGNIAILDTNGNLVDSNKASVTYLPNRTFLGKYLYYTQESGGPYALTDQFITLYVATNIDLTNITLREFDCFNILFNFSIFMQRNPVKKIVFGNGTYENFTNTQELYMLTTDTGMYRYNYFRMSEIINSFLGPNARWYDTYLQFICSVNSDNDLVLFPTNNYMESKFANDRFVYSSSEPNLNDGQWNQGKIWLKPKS